MIQLLLMIFIHAAAEQPPIAPPDPGCSNMATWEFITNFNKLTADYQNCLRSKVEEEELNRKYRAKLETCVSNDFAEKIEEVTRNFAEQMLKVKNELEAAKETNQLNMLHFNGELKKVKTELQSTKESLRLKTAEHNAEIKNLTSNFHGQLKKLQTELEGSRETLQLKNGQFDAEIKIVKNELESSKTTLDQLRRENALLKKNQEKASKNQDIITSKIESFDLSSSKEPLFFDYTLGHSMTSTGRREIVKFDRPRAVSATKIYNKYTGKVTIEEDGLYYFYAHGLPYEKSGSFYLYIYVDNEAACTAHKEDGTRAHMSCAIVRHLKRGQTIYVQKDKKLFGNSYPNTGFLGFKLQ